MTVCARTLSALVLGCCLGWAALVSDAAADDAPSNQGANRAVLERAAKHRKQADAYVQARRFEEAIPEYKAVIAALAPLGAHLEELATAHNRVAAVLRHQGQNSEALPHLEAALKMRRRLFPGDHRVVAQTLNNLAHSQEALQRYEEAKVSKEEALNMYRRLYVGDHPDVAMSLNNLAYTYGNLGRHRRALVLQMEGLAMYRRLLSGDSPHIAQNLNNLAVTHAALGKHDKALAIKMESLEMHRRLFPGDHPRTARALNNLAYSYAELGRYEESIAPQREALGMYRRIVGEDHAHIATCLNNLAAIYQELGRFNDALALREEAFEMRKRLFAGDHPDVATSLVNKARSLSSLGRHQEALQLELQALAMFKRLFPGDHPHVATCLDSLAGSYGDAGQDEQALRIRNDVLAMNRRLFGDDHPSVASSLHNLAHTLAQLGRFEEAETRAKEAIRIADRVGWPQVHATRALLGELLVSRRRANEAVDVLFPAVAHLELRRRQSAALGFEGRARFMDALRASDPFSVLVRALIQSDRVIEALGAVERSRGREMLDLLERGRHDPVALIRSRALSLEDAALVARIDEVVEAVSAAEATKAAAAADLQRARKAGNREDILAARRAHGVARRAVAKALQDRLGMVRDALPEGRPLRGEEVQAILEPNDRLLVYLLDEPSFVFVVSSEGVEVHTLGSNEDPVTPQRLAEMVGSYVQDLARQGAHDPGVGADLFKTLLPDGVWNDVRGARRLFILPHGPLHRLPFEALVVGHGGGRPRYLADEAPPISYAASATVLAHLMRKQKAQATGASILALADPVFAGVSEWPGKGLVVTAVDTGTQAHAGLFRAGDVITAYDGAPTDNHDALVAGLKGVDPNATEVVVTFERDGVQHVATLKPGRMGVQIAQEPPPVAGPQVAARARAALLGHRTRGRLQPVPGTLREVRHIEGIVQGAGRGARVASLVGPQATEARLYKAAQASTILHVATHGLVGSAGRARDAALALTPPRVPVPGDDGFLTLGDLLERWRGRLDGTAVVVLSACESQAGSAGRQRRHVSRCHGASASPVRALR